ncbi:MAG: hypothetical protein WAN81_10825 [Candidatus Binataceae bacterium]
MAGMKFRHAVVLVLVIWYLMRPPLPHLNTHAVHTHGASPLSRWVIVKGFPTQKECEVYRRDNRWELCIASDDPRLIEK